MFNMFEHNLQMHADIDADIFIDKSHVLPYLSIEVHIRIECANNTSHHSSLDSCALSQAHLLDGT